MSVLLIIITILLAAGCGIFAYAFSASRRQVYDLTTRLQSKESECTELSEQFRTKEIALVSAEKDVQMLRDRIAEEEVQLKEKNEMLMLQFEKVANDIFERKTRQFKDTNKESLDIILKPFKDNIVDFKSRVEEIYSKENENRGALKAELRNLMELNKRITEETNNLTTALRGNSKVQGDWGEMILDTILAGSNLQKGIHYTTQENVKDEQGTNLRPDVILNLPDGKRVVIDSKVSLTAYVNYCACEDEESRRKAMTEHVRSVRNHMNELGRKSYQDSVLGSPDFVIMFIPTEPAFLAAVQSDSEIWSDAYRKKVIVSSPTNLFGMLKIVDDLWKRDDLGRNANRIAKEGAMMYDKFVGFVNTLEAIGKNVETMQGNYDKAMKQLRTGTGNLVSRAQRLSALNIKVSKSLPQTMLDDADEEAPEI